jgi:hypothetical protein
VGGEAAEGGPTPPAAISPRRAPRCAFDLVNFRMDKGFGAWGEATGFYGAQYDEQGLGKKK